MVINLVHEFHLLSFLDGARVCSLCKECSFGINFLLAILEGTPIVRSLILFIHIYLQPAWFLPVEEVV